MTIAIVIFILGLMMSAFFSGSETGMYRVTRVRLVMDALSGRWSSRAMIGLLNRPALFVATALVGNNLANYCTSLAIVLGVQSVFADGNAAAEIIGPMMMTPVVFVLGELLPKHLFYQAPYRLLQVATPILLTITILFLPITLVLGLMGRILQSLTGEMPFKTRVSIGRSELEQLLREGQEAGIVAAGQRRIAQNLAQIGSTPAARFGVAADRFAVIRAGESCDMATLAARRAGHPVILVCDTQDKILGWIRYGDLVIAPTNDHRDMQSEPADHDSQSESRGDVSLDHALPVVRSTTDSKHLDVLLEMYRSGSEVAVLRNESRRNQSSRRNGRPMVVTRRQLLLPLLQS
ncbi:MAG: DUF21 domain-containing protein [Planctomycetota bacterium]